jgi:hypothetical protein
MLARRLTTIRPAMTLAEAVETTHLYHVAGLTGGRTALVTTRQCRAPHHTVADAGLIGRRQVPTPGRCLSRPAGCAVWGHCPRAAATSWRAGGNRSRMVSYTYNLAGVLSLVALAAIAGRFQDATDETLPH